MTVALGEVDDVHHLRDVDLLVSFVSPGDVLVLSGAGLSTESGIPDYRGPTGVLRRSLPMTYQLFTRDPAARQRYWARSHLGWRTITGALPNDGHLAVAELQALGLLAGLVTQNVDGLHQAAGAHSVIELHGGLDQVICLGCGTRSARTELHERLAVANRGWTGLATATNPDGDVDLSEEAVRHFVPVDCWRCGGLLKPDVVFFGENVPRERVASVYALVESARALLVLGSSLTVASGLRFVHRAAALGRPVAIVNQGATRGDDLASVKADVPLGPTLMRLVGELRARK